MSSTTSGRPAGHAKVHQVLATLGYGDAIGHEVLGIQRALREAGFTSDIFVETADPRLELLTRDYRELPEEAGADDLLIHHFSLASKASRTAYALPSRMALIYHNITPPEYLIDVNPFLALRCWEGRRELGAYVARCDLALGDSEFNRQELEALGFPRTGVLPVVPSFAHLDVEPDWGLASQFDDGRTNILFVGRVIPHKKIEDLIKFFHAYRSAYNPHSRLLIVGSYEGFGDYLTTLNTLTARLHTPDVHLVGQITDAELAAFYEIADVFLCASEHEGFCVPLVESFHERLPVIAYAATAVPATMDGGGVLYDDKNPGLVAALIDVIVTNQALRETVLDAQDAALDRLLARDFAGTLLGYVDQARHGPRLSPWGVVSDFWQQFDMAERLERLRTDRPAIYQALPKDPAAP